MIVFITQHWQLDLTEHRITFVEESSLFYDYFVSKYTLPFSIELNDELALQLGLIGENNISNYSTRHEGVLQQDGNFAPAILEIDGIENKKISGSFLYGHQNNTLLSTNLADLPWPVVTTKKLTDHAQETITKSYPEVGYNFPMVIDSEIKQTTNYEHFDGIKNYFNGSAYIINDNTTIEGEKVAINKNILTPMPYIMEILKVGFTSVGILYGGDFFSDPINHKLIWDTGVFLDTFKSSLPPFYQFAAPVNSIVIGNGIEDHFYLKKDVKDIGGFSLRIYYHLPKTIKMQECTIHYKGKRIFQSFSDSVNTTRSITVKDAADFGLLEFRANVFTEGATDPIESIAPYHFFSLWTEDSTLNTFSDVFTLADVMPDMKFSTFLNTLKNWLNLDIKFGYQSVTIDYVEQKFLESTFIDETDLQATHYKKGFNKNKAYCLKENNTKVYVTKNGQAENLNDFKAENISTINLGVRMMQVQGKNGVYTSRRTIEEGFQILGYDGLQNRLPVGTSIVKDIKFKDVSFRPVDIYNRFWKNWLRFRTNSEPIKETFNCDIFDELTTDQGKYKYNKKMLVKKISKRRVSEDTWAVSTESETLG